MRNNLRLFPNRTCSSALALSLIALLSGVIGCRRQAGVGPGKKAAPPVEAKGPIVSMFMASSIDGKGRVLNPRFNFPQGEPQVTAIIQVAKTNSSSLHVAWFKTSDDGDEKLFEHQIHVKTNDRAFSVGKNPGKALATGTYKVMVTLEGETREMDWAVMAQGSSAKNDRAFSIGDNSAQTYATGPFQMVMMTDSPEPTPNPAPTSVGSSDANGQTPIAGLSGTLPSAPASTICLGGGEPPGCADEVVDTSAPFVDAYVFNPTDRSVDVNGAVVDPTVWTGDPVGIALPHEQQKDLPWNACDYSSGSDLPGAKFKFFAELGDGKYASTVVTLGDDTSLPIVKVVSTPARGTKVKTGDKINLKVTASETRGGGSWQTGIKVIQVTAEPGGLLKDPWVNPANLPKACNEKTWEQEDEATYIVPKNPPPIIKICAIAEDYAGNQGIRCGEFVTGDIWKGTMHSDVQASFGPPAYACSSAFDATLKFVVAGGEIDGDGRATYTSSNCREGVSRRCDGILFKVRGRAYNDRLELQLVFNGLIPPRCANWGFGSAYFKGQPITLPINAPGIIAPGGAQGRSASTYTPDAATKYVTDDSFLLKCETCWSQK